MTEERNLTDENKKEKNQRIKTLANEINISEGTSILFFGNKAQQKLTTIADNMLAGVRSKDTGDAGNALNEMISVLRGFDVEGLNPEKKRSLFSSIFGKAKPVTKFLQQYEEVHKQINLISIDLERHKTKLLTDIVSLDRLYSANLEYFHELELYISAGDKKLNELDQNNIPKLETETKESQEMLKAQELRDLRAARDDLERRIHDLRLTRQVAMQSLPSIRLVQENDKGLVNKITSTVSNTLPLWRQQLATAVTIHRTGEATKTIKAASDLTNQLLEANAKNLKLGNAEARAQMERGVFDMESIKKANKALIDTIEESLKIADHGKQRRQEALTQLEACELELKKTLASASGKTLG